MLWCASLKSHIIQQNIVPCTTGTMRYNKENIEPSEKAELRKLIIEVFGD